jgi:site-specific recombinase XerD
MKEYDEYIRDVESAKSPKTLSSYKWVLNNFIKYFNFENIEDISKISSSNIQEYLNSLTKNPNAKNKNAAKASANANARVIKVFLSWLVSKKYLEKSPFTKDIKKFKEAKTVKVFFNKEERDKIILACKNKLWLQVTIALLFYTGLRRAEAINLKKSDFYKIDGVYSVLAHRKGNKEQTLPFPSFVGKLIEKYLDERNDNSEYLLVGIRTHDKISDIALGDRVKEACRLAGFEEDIINKTTAHTLRRSFACILYLEGRSTLVIMNCLNHTDPKITDIYIEPAKALMTGKVMSEQENPSWYVEDED